MKRQLQDLFFEHAGKRVDKWEQHLGIYESELAPFIARGAPVRLLEVGVQNGGSLEVWSKYLPPGSAVRGIDIDGRAGALEFSDPGIVVAVADASDAERLDALFEAETFDVIIDNGLRVPSRIIASFHHLFPRLSPGGKYFIEEPHRNDQGTQHGADGVHHSTVDWLRHLIDFLNADPIESHSNGAHPNQQMSDAFGGSLARIAFYDCVAVVEKLPARKTPPYPRVQVGQSSEGTAGDQRMRIEPSGDSRPILQGQAADQPVESRLSEALKQVHRQQAVATAALERSERLEATLEAQEAASRHQLQLALASAQTAFREEVGTVLGVAVRARLLAKGQLAKFRDSFRSFPSLKSHLPWSGDVISRRRRDADQCRLLFDADWYLQQIPDAAVAGEDLLQHYMEVGWTKGLDPHPLFDVSWYLKQYPDVAAAKMDPLAHYLKHGAAEGRDPNPLFDTSWYVKKYPDVAKTRLNPLLHYILHGAAEGRDPHELFDTGEYLRKHPEVAAAGLNPLAHHFRHGIGGASSLVDASVAYGKEVLREQQRLAMELSEIVGHIAVMLYKPTFVIVVEGTNQPDIEKTRASLRRQIYTTWSTCEPGSDKTLPRTAVSIDAFVIRLVAGDVLHDKALYALASALNADPTVDLIYTDEDRVGSGERRSRPFYKPQWSPDYLESFNYVGMAACFRGAVADSCWTDSSSHYDFVLRFTERTDRILHLNEVLFHRRSGDAATVDRTDSDVAALQGRLQRTGRAGVVKPVAAAAGCYDLKIALGSSPLVSVIIPTAGKIADIEGRRLDLLANCLDTIAQRSTYRNLDFVIVDNGDLGEARLDDLRKRGCRTITFTEEKFNIAKKLNLGASIASGEMLLLLNDDIEPLNADWIERLLEHFEKPHVGVVGAKLLYPDGKLQHLGVTIGQSGPEHVRRHYPRDDAGYFFSSVATRNFAAVTGACMMTRADVFRRVRGYNESLAVSYNDVDYCLKVRECGLTVVYAPAAQLTHFESQSRTGVLDKSEHDYFERQWAHMVTRDPFYNQDNLTIEPSTFEVSHNPRHL